MPKKKTGSLGDGKRKKKKKGGKTNAAEKYKKKMDKGLEELKSSVHLYVRCLDKAISWLQDHNKLVTAAFKHCDKEGVGYVSAEQFAAGLVDMGAPLNQLEVYGVIQATACIDGSIEVAMVEGLLKKEKDTVQDDWFDSAVPLQRSVKYCRPHDDCPVPAEIVRAPGFVTILLRLLTYRGISEHPLHWQVVMESHMTLAHVIARLRDEKEIAADRIYLYIDTKGTNPLREDVCIEDLDAPTGSCSSAPEILLYYNYLPIFNHCAILGYDHYFAESKFNERYIKGLPAKRLELQKL